MDMGHLYDDSHFSSPTIELDVREQMKTREVNAREARNLERQSKSYERAKGICERNTTWERWKVGQTLQTIWERSPRLERSLAVERARVEALQRALLRRTYQKASVFPVANDAQNVETSESPQSLSAARSARRKSHRQRRGRDRQKTNRKEEGRPLNTDFRMNRHLQKQADFVRRSEHVIKALARLNWRQESRRRDHEKFKEELMEHSKPVMDRARVVLKGRPDLDVDSFLQDFQDYLTTDSTKSICGSLATLPGSKVKQGNSEREVHQLTRKNILKLDHSDDRRSFLPSVVSSTYTSTADLRPVEWTTKHCLDENNNENCNDVKLINIENEVGDAGSEVVDANGGTVKMNNVAGTENVSTTMPDPLIRRHTGHVEHAPSTEEFHLPSIHQPRAVSNERASRSNDDDGNSSPNNVNDRKWTKHRSNSNSNGSDSDSEIIIVTPNNNSNNNSKTNSTSTLFSPSTSVSQVIFEEQEGEEDKDGDPSTSYHHHHYKFNKNNNSSSYFQDDIFTYNNEDEGDTEEENKSYLLASNVGLPRLWQQAGRKQKEKPAPEVSASTLARKHKRRRNNSNNLL